MQRFCLFIVLLCSFIICSAQQRSIFNIKDIVDKHVCLHNLDKLSLKAKSSDILPEENFRQGKEFFYIYSSNSNDRYSFVIVSGDEKLPPVLGYSDSNNFDENNMPPALKYWLETYVKAINDTFSFNLDYQSLELPYKSEEVKPLLESIQWSQGKPYNNLCPTYMGEKTVTGCVATAMAQVMKFYSYPTQGKGIVSYRTATHGISVNHDFSNDYFEWDNMLNSYTSSYSDQQAKAVAVLMSSCGASVKMDYGTSGEGGSGAYQSDLLKGYIENYGYDNDAALVIRNYCSTEDWHKLLVNELNAGRPVNYAGRSIQDGGHSFIIDGYKMSENTYPDYHVNWGWNGSCDGYYQLINLHPQEEGTNYTNNAFSESQQMTIGVMPEDGNSDSRQILCSSKLNSSLSKVKIGNTITFNVSSLYNCSYKKFVGLVSVALEKDSDQYVVLNNGNKYQLEYSEGTSSISLSCNIPDTISCGKYKCCLVYYDSESNGWNKIFSSSYPQIEVTDNDKEENSEEIWAEIGCSEFELLQQHDKNIISANIYELINRRIEAFTGCVYLTLADENGYPICNIGDSINIPELGYYDYLEKPIYVSGSLDMIIPNGYYRLYLSCKNKNQSIGSYVVQNNLEILGSQGKELFYNVRIKEGKVYIDGKEYEITPTNINSVELNSNVNSFPVYNISGEQVSNKTKGIFITNGKKIVIN